MKSLYRHKQSGDIFAIETDEAGNVRSTSGPLFAHFFKPSTAKGAFGGFTHGSLRLFVIQFNQTHLF